MPDYRRTHNCNQLRISDVNQEVTLSGWVHRRRDHGGLIFIDLRDRYGLTQLLFKPHPDHASSHQAHLQADQLRSEWVISAKGRVIAREAGMKNGQLPTGEIEIEVLQLEILSKAKSPPFSISDASLNVSEELRLRYRYLDMRRGPVQQALLLRHKLMLATRNYMDKEGFCEVITPILGKSTPEGARDYLVPSRIYPGSFYALPQSPQIFKQLLMIGGMDRYFQIATCFRDEDLRADRQPEFSQIDIEMSFGTCEDLFSIVEKLVQTLFSASLQKEVKLPFRRLTYQYVVEKYGTDKPDLRFDMPLLRLTDILQKSQFSLFLEAIDRGDIVKGLCVKQGAELSRKEIEEYTAFVMQLGAQGLAWIKMQPEGPNSNIVKFFPPEVLAELIERVEAQTGDLIFMIAAPEKQCNQLLDHLRRKIAQQRNLIDKERYEFAWVTDFPLFQWDEETKGYASEHHPFTSPHLDDLHLLESDPLAARSSSYDLVLNGYEIASGSQRIFNEALQEKIFRILNLTQEEIVQRFGFFIEALSFGTPPHLGIALGLDRLVMVFTKQESIREVIAFPKTQKAADLMSGAPSFVDKQQLNTLKIHVET